VTAQPDSRADSAPERGRRVRIEIVEILGSGRCTIGLELGDAWVVDSPRVPAGICMWAWASITPFLTPLRFGGSLPWEDDAMTARVCCPDPANPVVFRLSVLDD
jgi:uncharacterized repeat protein (TIGR04076 family)